MKTSGSSLRCGPPCVVSVPQFTLTKQIFLCGTQSPQAGQTRHTLKGGERSETGEPRPALEMEFSGGLSWIPGGQNVRLTWNVGNALDSSPSLRSQETWGEGGLPAPSLPQGDALLGAGGCVSLCALYS